MSNKEDISEIIENLKEVMGDNTVPKNIKEYIQKIIKILEGNDDLSVKVNKSLNYLDEIANDVNMQAFTRTQIWNIVSMLEKLNS